MAPWRCRASCRSALVPSLTMVAIRSSALLASIAAASSSSRSSNSTRQWRADVDVSESTSTRGALETVARREPAVLADDEPIGLRETLAMVVAPPVVSDQRLHQPGDRDAVERSRLDVENAHLDGAETRMRSDVPPQVRVVEDRACALEALDAERIVLVRSEGRRQPTARERLEDDRARGAQARRLTSPERTRRRNREQKR